MPVSKPKLKAYAIFDGGGVLGAALAGCLKAANDVGIEFVGYGGTSAGSIIATLGAVGMPASMVADKVLNTEFTDFLEKDAVKVTRFKKRIDKLGSCMENWRPWNFAGKLWGIATQTGSILKMIGEGLGVDAGADLQRKLHQMIAEYRPDWNPNKVPEITFDLLGSTQGCHPLKIVASDVTKRKPVVFSASHKLYSNSVLEAVRASTCYPFVFRPFQVQQRRLVDGGLSSNLPASLFHAEHARTGFPVFAFDLVSEEEDPPTDYGLKAFLGDMISTAIDAGDEFMRDVLEGVYHVPIPIPRRFDVLNFAIDKDDREALFNIGHVKTTEFLNAQPVLSFLAGQDSPTIQTTLQGIYGEPALYQPVLAAVAREIESVTKARNVRVTVMLPTGQGTRIVVYSFGMNRLTASGSIEHDPDFDLMMPEDAGVSGRAWRDRSAIVGDLDEARLNPEKWGLTPLHMSRVPKDRRSMISVPISGRIVDRNEQAMPPIGTLTLDSSTILSETSWTDGSEQVLDPEVLERLMRWADIIRRLLLFPE